MIVLGVNAVFHDPAAALVVDGRTVAAVEEERLTRDVIDRVPSLGAGASGLRQRMADERLRHRRHTREHGDDPADVRDWTWPGAGAAAGGPSGDPA